jgi:DMSO/TMAO reductase YedYZ molybdopterin-dependent catalytic subunit
VGQKQNGFNRSIFQKEQAPPGQHVIGYFPRFGVRSAQPRPRVREPAVIRVEGAVARCLEVPVSRLAELKRRAIVADFHCVAGWTAQDLHWCGVTFRTFYETVIVPEARPEPGVSHILFQGADGYRSVLALDDVFENDVLLADQLGETPLNGDHGAPLRLVSPKQYGYKSTKHLCCIELLTGERADGHERAVPDFLLTLLGPHPRARVSEEERHRYLPAWALRRVYWKLYRPLAWAARRGSRS